jgi:hypothetical protein
MRNRAFGNKEEIIYGEGHRDLIVHRGIHEALACQDMLGRAPMRPSVLTRAISRFALPILPIVYRDWTGRRRVIPKQYPKTMLQNFFDP